MADRILETRIGDLMDGLIDLHTHSTFSDGSLTPTQLVDEGRKTGLAALSLTDHDTTDGLGEFLAAGARAGLQVLPGVEISVDIRGRTVHMLGYGINPGYGDLRKLLRRIVEGRNDRNKQMIRKLQMLGVAIELNEVEAIAGEEVVGRPHVAQVLMDKGLVGSFDEAFDRYLARGAPAYCERLRPSPEDAISMIDAAGGVSVLAHPYLIGSDSPDALAALVARLKANGLAGIEVYYTEHTEEQTRLYLEMATRFELLVTGGTDFHGSVKPEIALGRGHGNLQIPYALFERLFDRIKARQIQPEAIVE